MFAPCPDERIGFRV